MVQDEFEQDEVIKHKKGMGKGKIIAIVLALVLLAGAGAGGGFYLYNSGQKAKAAVEQAKKADPEKTVKRYEDLKIEVTVDADDPMFRKIDFAAAQAVNPDVYAWNECGLSDPSKRLRRCFLLSGTYDRAAAGAAGIDLHREVQCEGFFGSCQCCVRA